MGSVNSIYDDNEVAAEFNISSFCLIIPYTVLIVTWLHKLY